MKSRGLPRYALSGILLSFAVLHATADRQLNTAEECPPFRVAGDVFRSPAWLHGQLQAGNVSLLDARTNYMPHVQDAVHVSWSDFSPGTFGKPDGGLLKSEVEMRDQLQALGVSSSRQVVVYGEWSKGWGAEGRIYWMLKLLGHQAAFVLDGGFDAYASMYPADLTNDATSPQVGVWVLDVTTAPPPISATKATVQSTLPFLVDTRTAAEYEGSHESAYGVARDGHITSAVSFPFSELFRLKEGAAYDCLRSCQDIETDLMDLGWTTDRKIVAYCTGGIRSAFFWAVVQHCQLDGANYAGSMWEWAADLSLPMTLGPDPSNSTIASASSRSQSVLKAALSGIAVLSLVM